MKKSQGNLSMGKNENINLILHIKHKQNYRVSVETGIQGFSDIKFQVVLKNF